MATSPHHTLTVDGMTVAFVEEGDGPPLLLLHGWPTSSFLYRHITPVLAQHHRVVVPDLPASARPASPRPGWTVSAGRSEPGTG